MIIACIIFVDGFDGQTRQLPVEYLTGAKDLVEDQADKLCESLRIEFEDIDGLRFSYFGAWTRQTAAEFRVALSMLEGAREGEYGDHVVLVCRAANRQKVFLKNARSTNSIREATGVPASAQGLPPTPIDVDPQGDEGKDGGKEETRKKKGKGGRTLKWENLEKLIRKADSDSDSDDSDKTIAAKSRQHNPTHPDRAKVDAAKVQQVRSDMKRKRKK